jgi:hypothetical protein
MKALLINVLTVIATAAAGYVAVRAMGRDPHVREMLMAGGAVLAGAVAAVVPLLLAKGGDQIAVSQAGLVSTLLHLMVSLAVVAVIMLSLKTEASFIYWVVAFFMVTLFAVSLSSVRAVRSAAMHSPTPK